MDMATTRIPVPAASAAKGKTSGGGSPLGVVERACRFIEARVDDGERFTLAELGTHCAMSPWHLQRQFRQAMGVSSGLWRSAPPGTLPRRAAAGRRRGRGNLWRGLRFLQPGL